MKNKQIMNQKKKWTLLKRSSNLFELEMNKGLLLKNGVDAVILNKQDSSYHVFGEGELLAKEEDFEQAQQLLKTADERNS